MNFCIGRDVTIGVVNGRCALCENPRLAFFARPKTFVSVRCSNVSYRSYKEMNQDFKAFLVLQKINPDSEKTLLKKSRLQYVHITS